MKTIKVTMLGPSGVGKTSLLAAIYNQYKSALDGTELQILPDYKSEAIIRKRLAALEDIESATFLTPGWTKGSDSEIDYSFELSQTGGKELLKLQFKDYPGQYINDKRDRVQKFMKESEVVIIAIDSTALLETKKGESFHKKVNGVDEITSLFERTYKNLNSPKLVILAPVRCESYYKQGKYEPKLLQSIELNYDKLLRYLESSLLVDKVAIVITPVQTVGKAVEFNDIDIDQDGKLRFMFVKTGAKYNPKDSEQPLRYILRFALSEQIKRRWRLFNWFARILRHNKNKRLKKAVDTFIDECKTKGGFKVIQGHNLLDV